MTYNVVVFTPGRTGSQLIARNLSRDINFSSVYHTHNPLYQPDLNECYAVVSTRDMFDSMMSTFVAAKTNEFITYTNREITPFSVSLETLDETYIYYKSFYQLIKRELFKEVIEISYEDLCKDQFYLFSRFGINKQIINYVKKSPYDYQQLITNVNELREYFKERDQRGISPELLESARHTVLTQLNDIKENHHGNRLGQTL